MMSGIRRLETCRGLTVKIEPFVVVRIPQNKYGCPAQVASVVHGPLNQR